MSTPLLRLLAPLLLLIALAAVLADRPAAAAQNAARGTTQPTTGTREPPLVIASVPWRSEATLTRFYAPLIELLERKLERQVRFFVAGDYRELGERMGAGAVDIGIFGGNSYVEAKEANPALRYLVTSKAPDDHYRSFIVTRADSPIRTLDDLKGRSFAFTDRGSTSGYVYPRMVLRQGGIDPDRDLGPLFMLKRHDKVYDAIARGSVEAGAASSTGYQAAVARNGDHYRLLARSQPIPHNAFVAAPSLPEATFTRLRQVLLDAENDPRFHADSEKVRGFSLRSDAFYDVVREARRLPGG
ncbi:phosphate/phosphite/phosphonate ABC transporter substrate-binding protein [Endothiovibrio diazotrophicus]